MSYVPSPATDSSDSYTTAGCHPTSTSEIDKYPGGADKYFADLEAFIESDIGPGGSKRVVSLGEIGLGELRGLCPLT